MNYVLLYSFLLIFTFSIIGYGFLISKITNKELLSYNLGYQGLLGIFFLTIISYTTIFFVKHNYIHNLIIHFIGLSAFFYFFKKKISFFELSKLILIISIFFIGILILVNHDDFSYYHLTYSLGLTEDKLIFGLGNFQHGYRHHSSIFFFNSIIYLPFIKFYLFHSLGWFVLIFANYLIIDFLLFKKIKELKFEYFFYLLTLIFINVKYSRIGGYGTDLPGQIILLLIVPLIYSTLKLKTDNTRFSSNLSIIIFLIVYSTTLKSFFILNLIFLIPFFFFFNFKEILKQFFLSKTFIISFFIISLLLSINIAYTGCAIYPVKQTCFENKLSWSLSKKDVERMNKWYHQWSKAGAGINYRVKDPENYIKGINWVGNWYDRYFEYKGNETLRAMLVFSLIFLLLYRGPKKEIPDKKNKKITWSLFILTIILSLEWFFNHPALRYGGYYLLCIIWFIPLSIYLGSKKFLSINKKKITISLIVLSIIIFNARNLKRIDDEFLRVTNHNFPLFYVEHQTSDEIDLGNNIKVYIPNIGQGCWVAKTPCVHGASGYSAKNNFGFKIINGKKNRLISKIEEFEAINPAKSLSTDSYEVASSMRFNPANASSLTKTFESTSSLIDRKKLSLSFWVKRSTTGTQWIFSNSTSDNIQDFTLKFEDDALRLYDYPGSYKINKITNRLFLDSKWYSIIIIIDTKLKTASDRVKIYVNGVRETSFSTNIDPDQNYSISVFSNTDKETLIGARGGKESLPQYFDGYLSEFYTIVGKAKASTDFGKFDESSGKWKPIKYEGSYDNNDFFLDFADNENLGDDESGNENDFLVFK